VPPSATTGATVGALAQRMTLLEEAVRRQGEAQQRSHDEVRKRMRAHDSSLQRLEAGRVKGRAAEGSASRGLARRVDQVDATLTKHAVQMSRLEGSSGRLLEMVETLQRRHFSLSCEQQRLRCSVDQLPSELRLPIEPQPPHETPPPPPPPPPPPAPPPPPPPTAVARSVELSVSMAAPEQPPPTEAAAAPATEAAAPPPMQTPTKPPKPTVASVHAAPHPAAPAFTHSQPQLQHRQPRRAPATRAAEFRSVSELAGSFCSSLRQPAAPRRQRASASQPRGAASSSSSAAVRTRGGSSRGAAPAPAAAPRRRVEADVVFAARPLPCRRAERLSHEAAEHYDSLRRNYRRVHGVDCSQSLTPVRAHASDEARRRR